MSDYINLPARLASMFLMLLQYAAATEERRACLSYSFTSFPWLSGATMRMDTSDVLNCRVSPATSLFGARGRCIQVMRYAAAPVSNSAPSVPYLIGLQATTNSVCIDDMISVISIPKDFENAQTTDRQCRDV